MRYDTLTLYRINDDDGQIEGYLSDMVGVLMDEGILVAQEPTDRICTTHRTFTGTDYEHCYVGATISDRECALVDVVRVTP